ncbi:MAG: glycoside hydrolase family 3 C-terminal domain-containing protein [Melioribacteraceae bacterium]|nr:glycoside hydrolase family 3 C-terminal domain-containing protein [Melioribacteraceae bacterium]MCF8356427.1 glycoside hydrolase family 3 C-terminal domain-containing protein [Melioribacteraceae bacterium]MCF8395782.1 glycoside hydrolase family 3 C-terminal domain-containing protein [Melioribacteraceae bacterium]MCF8420911.1 glycoside hydrolase family 3 C-terminal domain-containing protein [Melioribacteraceae bacterium]
MKSDTANIFPKVFLILVLLGTTITAQNLTEEKVNELLSQMSLQEKLEYIGGYKGFYIRDIERIGLPEIKMSDGPMGVRNYGPTTAYPASIGLAASFNCELAYKFGTAMGRDARARGVHIILAPGVNIYRAPFCGRNFEYLGEDPYLASQMVVPVITGIQSQEVVATVKHYIANNQEFDRHNVSSNVDERTLREIYMPAFKAAVQVGKVGALMTAYNLINGVHASEHDYLNNQVLKGEWGFDGVVMSDWVSTYSTEGVVNGGLDLEMPSGKFMNPELIMPLIESGEINEAAIDDKVRRILRMIVDFNFMQREQELSEIPKDDPSSRKAALQMAREAVVLLKNDSGLLPLNKNEIKKIAVIGPNSHPAVHGAGGSSFTTPNHPVSILEGIENLSKENFKVIHKRGIRDLSGDNTYGKSSFYQSDGSRGLKGEYYNNMNFYGEPGLIRIDENLNFVFNNHPLGGEDNSNFSVRWTGVIKPEKSALYRFYITGDDGYRLLVNGDTVLNAWFDQAPTTRSAVLQLESGKDYNLLIEYYQNGGGAELKFGYEEETPPDIDETVKIAAEAEAVILCVGFTPATEGEGRDREYKLPDQQVELIKKTMAANKNTIIALTAGGNVDMNDWIDDTNALLHVWYPGQEGGTAIAEIIFGDVNPSGKLPATFEKKWEDSPVYNYYHDDDNDKNVEYSEGIFVGYRYFDRAETKPRFPFGFGLSYTTFKYDNLKVDIIEKGGSVNVKAEFTITNTGSVPGAEAAQVYVSDLVSTVKRPAKELKGFEKVYLEPGETKTVEIILDNDAFKFYDVDTKSWILEPGNFEIMVGSSSRDIYLTQTVVL